MTSSLFRAATTGTALVVLATMSPAASAVTPDEVTAGAASCYDEDRAITVEEQRLTRPPPGGGGPAAEQILEGTGLDKRVRAFTKRLCKVGGYDDGLTFVRKQGKALWAAATARAQSDDPAGTLPASDDRGLYWARISMAKALRQWVPEGGLTSAQRKQLIKSFEYASRGITSSSFDTEDDATQVVVTGFDPFTLDADIRIGNPSGANALTLDGQRWEVDGRQVEIQTMVFPVRYADFDQGMVEDALNPHYRRGAQRADMVTTASQGRVGLFDLEVWNGRRRSVSSIGDNNNIQGGGTYQDPVVPPGMPPGPEFLRSSLPVQEMASTPVSPFTTRVNTYVVEIPEGEDDPVGRPDGPTDGSIAVEGGGGGYLSNEIAYRNTLRRDALAPRMPAGHLHVPVLQFGQSQVITDPTYEANREAIVDGAHRILRRGIAALG